MFKPRWQEVMEQTFVKVPVRFEEFYRFMSWVNEISCNDENMEYNAHQNQVMRFTKIANIRIIMELPYHLVRIWKFS